MTVAPDEVEMWPLMADCLDPGARSPGPRILACPSGAPTGHRSAGEAQGVFLAPQALHGVPEVSTTGR